VVLRVGGAGLRCRVGALGEVLFRPGHYCYVGSAMRGLPARLRRHFRGGRALHWHIDYLSRAAEVRGALAWPAGRGAECELSRRIAGLAHGEVKGFGCSDCGCSSHLHYFLHDPRPVLRGLRIRGTGPVSAAPAREA